MKDLVLWWRIRYIKLSRWEYWNSYLVCVPILPYLFFLWVKARSAFFFNAANPGIAYGGFLMESKWLIHIDAPEGFFPHTVCVHPSHSFDDVWEQVQHSFQLPVIAKPDIGSQGRGVAIIHSRYQLMQYHQQSPVAYLVQEKINYPMEAGIFYVRMPGEATGQLTGIVQKEYIRVTGNGVRTLRELLMQQPRYLLQIKALERLSGTAAMNQVIANGEVHTVLDIGNHARGALFLNASHKITPQLTGIIDQLCRQFPGFYFGRLDIRFTSWEALEKGEAFAVIELNGAGSEPTHIYDPSTTLFSAWKEIMRHWKMIYTISSYHHSKGVPYLSCKAGIRLLLDHAAMNKKLAGFHPAADAPALDLSPALTIA